MKKKLIKTLCLFVACLPVFGLEVQSLSQGSCWVSSSEDSVQVASFNEGKSYHIYRSRLEELVGFFHDNGISPTEIESIDPYLHCSGVGGRVVFRVKAQGVNYCTWSEYDGKSFKFKSLDLSQYEDGLCDGVVPNKIIVAPEKDGDMKRIVADLEDAGVVVEKVEAIFRDLHTITFKSQKDEVFKIKNILLENKNARIVDLVTRQHPIGDSAYLEALSFKK
ncbi:hypothetical protein [Bacteriovorax sp. DB6_IX]|uniref:hypothetical protein n=1 Tax=Bacteriovorax sp. DB6_IX TaxID=1353530 RepID=UPI00038A0ED7|nr:hypothetical protein [Bacteriovorax sp. DB6_IX]EQC51485.1 hypothetical protein M901_2814 [Bacteriovorax sp. DB6_IX]